VQAFPSSHAAPGAAKPSAGHAADAPVHVSATSQVPATARQVTPAGAGVQRSAASSQPAAQGSPSQGEPVPRQAPARRASTAVQYAPSSHGVPSPSFSHSHMRPAPAQLHASRVHGALLVESARFANHRADIARLNERLDRLEQRLGAKR